MQYKSEGWYLFILSSQILCVSSYIMNKRMKVEEFIICYGLQPQILETAIFWKKKSQFSDYRTIIIYKHLIIDFWNS